MLSITTALVVAFPIDGDPIADLSLVADPAKFFVVLMKDGRIYKRTL